MDTWVVLGILACGVVIGVVWTLSYCRCRNDAKRDKEAIETALKEADYV